MTLFALSHTHTNELTKTFAVIAKISEVIFIKVVFVENKTNKQTKKKKNENHVKKKSIIMVKYAFTGLYSRRIPLKS